MHNSSLTDKRIIFEQQESEQKMTGFSFKKHNEIIQNIFMACEIM